MKVVLFTNARDESHLREWAAHHLLLGFDNIVIFDHKSKIPLSIDFSHFDKRVRIINCGNMEGAIKMKLMSLAANIAMRLKADWMLYLDADEFIVLNTLISKIAGIKQFLAKFNGVDQLAVNWLMYGTSGIINELSLSNGDLILEKYTRSDELLNNHVKCFVRPHLVEGADNPHFFRTKTPHRNYGIDGGHFSPPFHNVKLPFYMAPIYIAHYVYQSENTYKKRKLNLPRDDNGGMRTDNDVSHIHKQYNVRDNFLASRLYSLAVRTFLIHKNIIRP
jgi:hypothetical protein